MPKPPLPDDVATFLTRPNYATISVVRPDGQPVSVPTWYLFEQGQVVVNMDAGRKRLDYLRADPRIRLETGFVRLATHEVRLAPEDEALWQRIAPHLDGETRFRPPRVRDLAGLFDADERDVRRVLKLTARLGRTDQIAHDHFFARATVAEMAAIVADVGAQASDGWIAAAAFRDRVQNGRKVAIEILDFFDRHGLTIRRGDLRRVNPHRLDLFGRPGAASPAQPEARDSLPGRG